MADDSNISSILKKINVLENRLLETSQIKTEEDSNLLGLFPESGECLYHYLLGDAYLLLWNLNKSSNRKDEDLDIRCIQSFESGVTLASGCLDIEDPLRLLLVYSWCNALIVLQNKYHKAKVIAEQTFLLASMHTHPICTDSVDLLQRLRDDIMLYQPKIGQDGESNRVMSKEEQKSIEDALKPVSKTRSSTKALKKFTQDVSAEMLTTGGMVTPIALQRRESAQCALTVRRVISIPVPVKLDLVSSAAVILRALDKIFRTYVRGTALPGQLAGGNTVEFDGTTLTFRNFILHGPYISWKGFVHFLLDFSVAAPPPLASRLGKAFLAEVLNGNKSRLPGGEDQQSGGSEKGLLVGAAAGGDAVVAPISMLEAAVVFVESSKSITPALVLSKFLKVYEEMGADIEGDPWVSVHAWAEEPRRRDWDIHSGLNFMQFVDCLGKLGMLAYSSSRYTELLPTAADKMEHFLSAYLGLTDQRKWQRRVERKLIQIKSTIKDVGGRSSTAATTGTTAATTGSKHHNQQAVSSTSATNQKL